MKRVKITHPLLKIRLLSLLAVFLFTAMSAFAQNIPQRIDSYVNDYANLLTRDQLNQLRSDVKSMCDYYSTEIAVCIVPTFGRYTIDDYAARVGSSWGVTDENGMLILVKPKSANESGEVMLKSSPDLEDVFSSDVCSRIVNQEMIPHFKENDYYGGIVAVLEYMNNMSDADASSNASAAPASGISDTEDSLGLPVWVYILLAIIVLVIFFFVSKNKKNSHHDNNEAQSPVEPSDAGQRPRVSESHETYVHPTPNPQGPNMASGLMGGEPEMNANRSQYGQAPNMMGVNDMMDDAQEGANVMYPNGNPYAQDPNMMNGNMYPNGNPYAQNPNMMNGNMYPNGNPYAQNPNMMNGNMYPNGNPYAQNPNMMGAMSGMGAELLSNLVGQKDKGKKSNAWLGAAAGVAAGVVGTKVVEKIIDKKKEDDDDDDQQKPTLGKSAAAKPKLGGNASSKPKLGGNNGGKPKLGGGSNNGGGSAKGSW